MSRTEKAIERIRNRPRDYTYSEAKSLLEQLGFQEYSKGKTSGSRMKFYREADGCMFLLHKPHPRDVMSPGAIDDFAEFLKRIEVL